MKKLSAQRKEELFQIFWRSKPDLILVTWFIENCEGYRTPEKRKIWEWLFEDKLLRDAELLDGVPKFGTAAWFHWRADAEREVLTRTKLPPQTTKAGQDALNEYANHWRTAPGRKQTEILFKLLLKFEKDMRRGKICGKIPHAHAPKNSLEFAYVEGLTAPHWSWLWLAQFKQQRKTREMGEVVYERIRSRLLAAKKAGWENMKDAQRGKKTAKARKQQSDVYSASRRSEWPQYTDFLNAYFKRSPTPSLTTGRNACANEFLVSLKTIERRTKGYQKPS